MNIKMLLIIGSIVCFSLSAVGIKSGILTNAGLALLAGSFLA